MVTLDVNRKASITNLRISDSGGNMISLRELTNDEFALWLGLSSKRQAADRAWASGRSSSDELRDVEAMVPHLLPDGKDTAGHTFRLAQEDNGQSVAFVWFGSLPGMPDDSTFLFDIHVEPEWRRRGVGRTVLKTMLQSLRLEGVCNVFLQVRGDNAGAIALYNKLGFGIAKTSEDGKQVEMEIRM
jgi:ribosomal protein S18 acetylase RimI-like enzyme